MNKETSTPEKMRELIKVIKDLPTFEYSETYRRTSEWLEQNQQEPSVRVLSDEQVYQVARHTCELGFDVGKTSINEIALIISEYLKDQAFTQPQQFKPNWEDAPEWATKCRIRVHWADDDKHSTTGALVHEEQRPTPPAPKVEVGRWKHRLTGGIYLVDVLGKLW